MCNFLLAHFCKCAFSRCAPGTSYVPWPLPGDSLDPCRRIGQPRVPKDISSQHTETDSNEGSKSGQPGVSNWPVWGRAVTMASHHS